VLEIILPHSFVLSTIYVLVSTHAIGLVVGPVAIVDVTVNMNESSLAMGSVLPPLSCVGGLVCPNLLAKSISEASLPLTRVHSSSSEGVWGSLLSWLVWVVQILGDCLTGFLLCEVLAASELLCPE